MKFLVQGASPHKIEAVRQAVGPLHQVEGIRCEYTKVNEQPVGFAETLRGALARARAVSAHSQPTDIAVGIESGILRSGGFSIDLAVVVMIHGADKREVVSTTTGIMFPETFVLKAEALGFSTTTVGSVIAQEVDCDGTDPHSYLTQGRVSRLDTLVQGVRSALFQTPTNSKAIQHRRDHARDMAFALGRDVELLKKVRESLGKEITVLSHAMLELEGLHINLQLQINKGSKVPHSS